MAFGTALLTLRQDPSTEGFLLLIYKQRRTQPKSRAGRSEFLILNSLYEHVGARIPVVVEIQGVKSSHESISPFYIARVV